MTWSWVSSENLRSNGLTCRAVLLDVSIVSSFKKKVVKRQRNILYLTILIISYINHLVKYSNLLSPRTPSRDSSRESEGGRHTHHPAIFSTKKKKPHTAR